MSPVRPDDLRAKIADLGVRMMCAASNASVSLRASSTFSCDIARAVSRYRWVTFSQFAATLESLLVTTLSIPLPQGPTGASAASLPWPKTPCLGQKRNAPHLAGRLGVQGGEIYVCMCVVLGGRPDALGACGDAEPRRCGQRHLGGANADQKDSLGPLACGDPDRKAGDHGHGRQHVVDSRVGRDRDRSPGARRLHARVPGAAPRLRSRATAAASPNPSSSGAAMIAGAATSLDRGVGAIRDGS